jgi:hypothetical protein
MIGIEKIGPAMDREPRVGELWKFSRPGWCPSTGTGLVVEALGALHPDDFPVYEMLVNGGYITTEDEHMEERIGQRNT